jgi:hypothetical protein
MHHADAPSDSSAGGDAMVGRLLRDPLMTADIRDALASTYRDAQEEVAVDRIAQVFGDAEARQQVRPRCAACP